MDRAPRPPLRDKSNATAYTSISYSISSSSKSLSSSSTDTTATPSPTATTAAAAAAISDTTKYWGSASHVLTSEDKARLPRATDSQSSFPQSVLPEPGDTVAFSAGQPLDDTCVGRGAAATAAATVYPPPPPPPLRNQEVDISREDPRRVSPASPQPSATTTTGHEHHHKDHYRYHSRNGGDETQHPRDGGGGADGRTHNPPTPLQGNVDDNPAISAHRDGCQRAAPPPPPPPVACTLVAFEPGSLGLELEAVVVESTGVGGSDGRRRGEEGQAVGRGKEGRRLGCRVFRVTPDGQAARHGSVHPGDALVVLDGVDVLSEPFDAITRALLERQGQRRLIGFMGAAAVTTASRAVDASVRPQSCGQRQPSNTGEHSSSTKPTVEHPWRPNDPTSSASTDPPSGFPVRPYPSSRSTPTRDVTDRILARVESTRGVNNRSLDLPYRLEGKGRDRSGKNVKSRRGFERSGAIDCSGDSGGGDGGVDSVGGNGESERRRWSSERGRGDDRESGRPRRRRSEHFATSPSPSAGSVVGATGATAGGKDCDSASDTHRGRQSRWQKQQRGSTPTAAVLDDSRRCSYTAKVIDVHGGGGARGERNSMVARRRGHLALTATWHGGEHARPQVFNSERDFRNGNIDRKRGRGGGGGEGSLGDSWDSSTSSMMMATTAGCLLGDRVRPPSLQRSLEEAIQEKAALAAERAWLLEELQRAKAPDCAASLEREGAIAGQEVQTDVLKMEVNALEVELRRARQDLAACEAGRRELNEATKQDIARRDREAADLSSQLRRERAARERETNTAAAAMAKASAAEKSTARSAAAARAEIAEMRRRADELEGRAAAAEERAAAVDASAREAAVDAAAALRRERERRETEVCEREEEISSLMLSLEAAEGRARKLADDKGAQMRELEEAAMRSLEQADRRRLDSEQKATALSTRLREREAEWANEERKLKELETQLRQSSAASKKQAEERNAFELQRLEGKLRGAEKALKDEQARARATKEQLSECLKGEERKASSAMERLRSAERRARMLETAADAARQRAEAAKRMEGELSNKLTAAETEQARQGVTITTLRTQLKELRRTSAAGESALREATRVRETLQDAMAVIVTLHPTEAEAAADAAAASTDFASTPNSPVLNGQSESAVEELDTGSRACLTPRNSNGSGGIEGGQGGQWKSVPLVELAALLRRGVEDARGELERMREALKTTRSEKQALRLRAKDAAELRSLLEEKRGLSAELARGAEAARVRAGRAEGEAERCRGQAESFRVELEVTERLLEEQTERAVELGPRVVQLEQALLEKTSEANAARVRAEKAERESRTAQSDLRKARERQAPLEEAVTAAESERDGAVKRLIRKDGDLLAVQSRLEAALAELDAVKLSIFQGSTDQRVAHKLKSCVLLASISSRQRARSTAETIALLRWRKQCLRPSAGPPPQPQPQPQPQSRESSARRSSSDPMSDAHDGEVWTAAAAAAGEEEKEGEEANSAAAARAEARRLARVNAEILEVNRSTRSELATIHLRTRMCGARVLTAIFQKWAARRSARAFWRLRQASVGRVPLISTTAADNANDNDVNSDPYTGAAAALVVDVSSLRITAPTSFEESGFPSASSGAGSPADGGRRGGWDHTRSSPADFGPPSSSRCGSGGGGGGDHRNPGDKTAATSPTAGGMDEYGGGSRRKGKPWLDDGPAMHERGRTHKSRRKRQQQPQPVRFRGSPPQSPASAQARAAFGFNVPSTAAYHTSYVGNSTATGGDDVGGAAVGGGGGSGGDLSTFGGHGVADVSFSSVASSEPRYHCLRSGSGRTGGGGGSGSESDCISPIMTGSPLGSLGGASSPVWVHMLGMSGDEEGEVVEAEAKSRGRIDTCQQRDGLHDRHREVGSASAGGMRAVVMAGGQGRQSNGEDGDGTKHLRDIGSPGVGDGVSVPGCGLRVEVAESESSWWALSDESV